MIDKYTELNLNRWRESAKAEDIDLDSIVVNHPTHKETRTIDFKGRIGSLSYNWDGNPVRIVVRKTKSGNYQLLFGLKQLIAAKLQNLKTLKAIIVSCDRFELIKYVNSVYSTNTRVIDMGSIKIYNKFKKSQPSFKKFEKKESEVKGNTPGLISVNEEGYLTDGYITYLVLKRLGVKETRAQVEKSERANSYKLKESITEEDLFSLGFKDASWNSNYKNQDVVGKTINLHDSIDLSIYIKTNPMEFDDFEDTLLLDFDFGQPYTPFYGDNYKKKIGDFDFLQKVISRYNQAMDLQGIFEEY